MRKRKIEQMALTTFALAACVALFGALAAGQANARGFGAGSHTLGVSSRPLRATAGWRPVNSTALQFIGSIHGAAIARDTRFAGKSGIGVWATLSTGIN